MLAKPSTSVVRTKTSRTSPARRLDPEKTLREASSIESRPGSNLLPKRLRAVETAGVALSQAFLGGLDPAGTQPEAFFFGLDPVDNAIGSVF
jgi:hypothetical protein